MASTTHHPKLVRLEVAAQRFDISVRSVRRMISEGRLTGYRIGARSLRVDERELDDLARRIPTAGHVERRAS